MSFAANFALEWLGKVAWTSSIASKSGARDFASATLSTWTVALKCRLSIFL